MYSFSYLAPVCCSLSGFNCCFLTCTQTSQQEIRCSGIPISFRIFQFGVIHTVKGFSVVNEAETDVFLELSCFFYDPVDVGNLISDSSAFSNPAWKSGISQFTYCWSLAWRILNTILLACEMSAIVRQFEHSLALPFFEIEMKADLFQSCGPKKDSNLSTNCSSIKLLKSKRIN